MSKIGNFFNSFHNSIFKDAQLALSDRKRKISLVIFYFSAFVVFMTLMSQMPALSSRGLTKIFQFGWILVLIPMIMLDYRHFLRGFANCLIILLPFLIYCIIAKIRGINSINYSGTTCILLAMFMVSIGIFYGKYFNLNFIRNIAIFYILGAAIYAGVVYINKLRGYNIDNPIYAFDDKNSAGPIFLTAALLTFIIFKRKNIFIKIIEIVVFCYFAAIIVLAKCRATIVFLPVALLFIHLFLPTTKTSKILSRIVFPVFLILCAAAIWFVPVLYQKIIVSIIMNGKKTITEAFAGRIEQIRYLMQHLQLAFGNGGYYIDCMPISFLSSYGIVGLVSLVPVAVVPFYSIIKGRKEYTKSFFVIELTILSLLLFNSLLEGYGYFGPGTKVFMLWLLTGYSYYYVVIAKKSSIYKLIDKPASLCNKLKPKAFIVALQVFLIAGSGLLIYTKTVSNNFGSSYVSILPENNRKSSIISLNKNMYISEETREFVDIQRGKQGMCTGQKIKFKHTLEPSNAMNGWANWLLGFVEAHHNAIKVDCYSGIVEAIATEPTKTMVQVFFPTNGDESHYIEFYVTKPENYSFNDGLIYTKPFKYSFEHRDEIKKEEEIELKVNHSIKFFYDTNYIPKNDNVSFTFEVVDNPSSATIDSTTGVFKATATGSYKVRGKITNEVGTFYTNEMKINVSADTSPYIPVNNISFDNIEYLKSNSFQYQPIEIKTKFNNENPNPTNKNFDIIVENIGSKKLDYEIDYAKNTITFKDYGPAKLTLKSHDNPEKTSETIEINVQSNPLIKFVCPNYIDWIIVGDYVDVKKMGLSLEFKNGYKKPVTEEDLYITDTRIGRAGTATGFINGNITEIKGIANGFFSYTYVAKINTQITYEFNLTTNVFTKDAYNEIVNNSGLIMVFIIVILLTPSLLVINFKKKWAFALVATSYLLVIFGMTFLSYPFNSFTLSCLIAFTAAIFFVSTLKFTLFANKEIKFIDLE